jgi:DDB1- and CUL4-associated factor 5
VGFLTTGIPPSGRYTFCLIYNVNSKLKTHTSCINALAFDSTGRFLASGGDDCDIHLWDFHNEDVDRREPCHTFIGPRNNIFNLEFSTSNKYLFSGGTDSTIRQHDVAGLYTNSLTPEDKLPKSTFREKDTIRDISCHPFNDEMFLSGR